MLDIHVHVHVRVYTVHVHVHFNVLLHTDIHVCTCILIVIQNLIEKRSQSTAEHFAAEMIHFKAVPVSVGNTRSSIIKKTCAGGS